MLKWLGISAAVLVLDQLTKFAVTHTFALHEMREMAPFFNLVLVYNSGAAFSLLSDAAGWQRELFIAIALGASIWIAWLLRKYATQTLFCLALALILGGAIGNVIDRVLVGAVVDFLDFHAFGYHWPAFNVADSAISCGAALLIWDALRSKADSREPDAASGTTRRV
ncbi:MAG TPA: signal peptidase II [Burkholderiales bacterium]|jgi:signal peptidase II|nr:signal peptidase II [Burkholderiales bacterium]